MQGVDDLLAGLAAAAAAAVGGTVGCMCTHLSDCSHAALARSETFPHLGPRIVVVHLSSGADPAAAAATAAAALEGTPGLPSVDPQGAALELGMAPAWYSRPPLPATLLFVAGGQALPECGTAEDSAAVEAALFTAAAWRRLTATLPGDILGSPAAAAGLLRAADFLAFQIARGSRLPLADPFGVPRMGLLAVLAVAAAVCASPAAAAELPSIGRHDLNALVQHITEEQLDAASRAYLQPWAAKAALEVLPRLQRLWRQQQQQVPGQPPPLRQQQQGQQQRQQAPSQPPPAGQQQQQQARPFVQCSADPASPYVFDQFGGSLSYLNGRAAFLCCPPEWQPQPSQAEMEGLVEEAARRHDLGSMGKSGGRYICESYALPFDHPLVQPFHQRIDAAICCSEAEEASAQPSGPRIKVAEGSTAFASVYPEGAHLKLHDHGPARAYKLPGGRGNRGVQRDAASGWHTITVGCRVGGGGMLAFQLTDGSSPIVGLHMAHANWWMIGQEGSGNVAIGAPDKRGGQLPIVRHGVPASPELFLTIMIKLRVCASSPAAALRLLAKCLQQQPPAGQHAEAAAVDPPQAELLTAADFACPAGTPHPGPPFGDHRSLVGFFRSQGSPGMRRLWDKLKAKTGGSVPFAFTLPDILRPAHCQWVLHEQSSEAIALCSSLTAEQRSAMERQLTPEVLIKVLKAAAQQMAAMHKTAAELECAAVLFPDGSTVPPVAFAQAVVLLLDAGREAGPGFPEFFEAAGALQQAGKLDSHAYVYANIMHGMRWQRFREQLDLEWLTRRHQCAANAAQELGEMGVDKARVNEAMKSLWVQVSVHRASAAASLKAHLRPLHDLVAHAAAMGSKEVWVDGDGTRVPAGTAGATRTTARALGAFTPTTAVAANRLSIAAAQEAAEKVAGGTIAIEELMMRFTTNNKLFEALPEADGSKAMQKSRAAKYKKQLGGWLTEGKDKIAADPGLEEMAAIYTVALSRRCASNAHIIDLLDSHNMGAAAGKAKEWMERTPAPVRWAEFMKLKHAVERKAGVLSSKEKGKKRRAEAKAAASEQAAKKIRKLESINSH